MKKTITMMSELYKNSQTGEKVEGITIMVDGALKQIFEIIQHKEPKYENNLSIVQDAFMKGLETIKTEIEK